MIVPAPVLVMSRNVHHVSALALVIDRVAAVPYVAEATSSNVVRDDPPFRLRVVMVYVTPPANVTKSGPFKFKVPMVPVVVPTILKTPKLLLEFTVTIL